MSIGLLDKTQIIMQDPDVTPSDTDHALASACHIWGFLFHPVLSQHESQNPLLCPTGFLFGDCDQVFGGTEMVKQVAKRFKSRFWTTPGSVVKCTV